MADEPYGDFSPRTVMREIDRLNTTVDKLADRVGTQVVSQTVFEMNRTEQGRRIGDIEDSMRWAIRLAITGVVTGISVPIVLAVILTATGLK